MRRTIQAPATSRRRPTEAGARCFDDALSVAFVCSPDEAKAKSGSGLSAACDLRIGSSCIPLRAMRATGDLSSHCQTANAAPPVWPLPAFKAHGPAPPFYLPQKRERSAEKALGAGASRTLAWVRATP